VDDLERIFRRLGQQLDDETRIAGVVLDQQDGKARRLLPDCGGHDSA
jgi:hypothetical protein